MQIVIPMAGIGKRFLDVGYTQPKSLISIEGKPMIQHVVELFSEQDDCVFICNDADLRTTDMKKILKKISPTSKISSVKYQKKGPVFDVMQAESAIDDTLPTIVNYCDFSMGWDYSEFQKYVDDNDLDGCIICYRDFHPHLLGHNLYASVRTDAGNNFLELREKYSFTENKMESWQSCGTYYFKSGEIMKKYFNQTIDQNIKINGEYYVSVVYNLMHQDGLKIKVFSIPHFCQWGTPEDLAAYTYWSETFNR